MNSGKRGWVPRLLILSVSFFLAGFFPLSILNLNHLSESWKERIQIRVFLGDQVSDETAQRFRNGWKQWEEVAEVRWVSRDQALKQWVSDRSWQGEKDAVLTMVEALGGNPLPHSLILLPRHDFRTTEGVQKISQRLQAVPEAAEVLFDQQGIQNLDLLSGWVKTAEIWGGVVMLLSLFVLVVLVMSDSDLSFAGGSLIGAGGAALSLLLLVLLYTVLSLKIPFEELTGLPGIQWSFFPWSAVGIWIAGGGILGALGGGGASLVRKWK